MPKVLQDFLGYAIYFWIEQNISPHVHVSKGKQTPNATKFWIRRDGVELSHNRGRIPKKDLRKIAHCNFINNNSKKEIAYISSSGERINKL